MLINYEFQNSKMGIDVFKLSCRDFFFGDFKTQIFFLGKFFNKKLIFRSKVYRASLSDFVGITRALVSWQVKIKRFIINKINF